MRHMRTMPEDDNVQPKWRIMSRIIPYLAEYQYRVLAAVIFLIAAKIVNVAVPVALKHVVDALDAAQEILLLTVPLWLLLGYGALRFLTTFLGELRDAIFARVAERAMRRASLEVFEHLHTLDLNFHLSRRTGALARDIERGTTGMSFLLRFLVFNIVPTLFEITLVAAVLWQQFSVHYVLAVIVAITVYVVFSVWMTEWRTRFVREANEQDNLSNSRAMDSLLNFETVKYFTAERKEAAEYDSHLAAWERSRLKNRLSLAGLNSGQALIIAVAVTSVMIMAAKEVVAGTMTLGDFVMVNAFMVQLFIPLNFLGFVYREIRQALINIEKMLDLLSQKKGIEDAPDATPLKVGKGCIRFDNVHFHYHPKRPLLKGASFAVNAGQKIAVVGSSGAGKSTLAKLLFRFYDVKAGLISIDGQDIRMVTQNSLRQAIGVVPQDTVLFNETLHYNIAYGNADATQADIDEAIELANLTHFIARLPEGLNTQVGERGLKVSGGEKQRIAIARVLLKKPHVLIFDEATSALDSHSENAIMEAINRVAQERTTLIIAHRLSTIRDADCIVVLDDGQVVEQGDHNSLISKNKYYAALWRAQQSASPRDTFT
ncbi:ABCB family ABC transporter ATP-binding protein/permease [Marinagarivorans algicola]|uniref:ABCB family ABC transporter ATP-binding protein/permease n=1 Tax=Marinagarivorans algicola TaxID=1513270 RepID=UPI0037358A12